MMMKRMIDEGSHADVYLESDTIPLDLVSQDHNILYFVVLASLHDEIN